MSAEAEAVAPSGSDIRVGPSRVPVWLGLRMPGPTGLTRPSQTDEGSDSLVVFSKQSARQALGPGAPLPPPWDGGSPRPPSPAALAPPQPFSRPGSPSQGWVAFSTERRAVATSPQQGTPSRRRQRRRENSGGAGGRKAPQIGSGSAMPGQGRPLKRGSQLARAERLPLVRALHSQERWRESGDLADRQAAPASHQEPCQGAATGLRARCLERTSRTAVKRCAAFLFLSFTPAGGRRRIAGSP